MDNTYRKALKKVEAKKKFYRHLGSFIAVGAFFLLMNAVTFDGDIWFFYPLLGWSIGLGIHYFSVFGLPGLKEDWEEQELQREIRRLERSSNPKKDEDTLELKELRKQSRDWEDDELV